MLVTIRSYMDEIEVINILKGCSDKKAERLIKSAAFLFAAIWLHLAHSWSGVKCMVKAKYKTLGNRYYQNYFSITTTSKFFKKFVFRGFFRLGCYMNLSKCTWK